MLTLPSHSHIHFIGVGGVSMSGLAHALADRGFIVSGSDRSESERTAQLRAAGVNVHIGHSADNIKRAEVVVYTTAIHEDNPELAAARAQGLQIVHRSEVLGYMVRGKHGIAITGTHGKSSTTAMLATIFEQTGRDPSVFVGADAPNVGGNYCLGHGEAIIFEACESDGSFVEYVGCSQVILNVEAEHLDQHGDFAGVKRSFKDFVRTANPEGFIVWCRDCEAAAEVIADAPCKTISYGLLGDADATAKDITLGEWSVSFIPVYRGQDGPKVTLNVPGQHNVSNGLAAITAAVESGIELSAACAALESYQGIGRRFEKLGEFGGATVIDDYAHHPTEVAATLSAARKHQDSRLIVAFQPHLYSRTQFFMNDFASALSAADVVILNAIYAAREDPIPGVSAEGIVQAILREHPGKTALYIPVKDDIVAYLRENARPGDLVIVMGAGDIRQVGEKLVATPDSCQ